MSTHFSQPSYSLVILASIIGQLYISNIFKREQTPLENNNINHIAPFKNRVKRNALTDKAIGSKMKSSNKKGKISLTHQKYNE